MRDFPKENEEDKYPPEPYTGRKFLFVLQGKPVYKGDVLCSTKPELTGWYCNAEFRPDVPDGEMVTVRSPSGAVPTVPIAILRWEPEYVPRCKACGQILPR